MAGWTAPLAPHPNPLPDPSVRTVSARTCVAPAALVESTASPRRWRRFRMVPPRAALLGWCLLACLALLLGCRKSQPAATAETEPAWFQDVTEKVGIDFVHDAG